MKPHERPDRQTVADRESGSDRVLRVIRAIVALMLLASALPLRAAEYLHAELLLRVHPLADGTVVLMFVSDNANCPSTASPKEYRIALGQNGMTADGLRAIQATALTALATGARLEIAFDNGTSNCYVNRALIRE